MLGSIGVIGAAIVIWFAIGLWVLPRTWELFKETTNILLEGVPEGIDLNAVARALKELPGVRGLHDLHVWATPSCVPSLSAHLVLENDTDADEIQKIAVRRFAEAFDIKHATLQIERVDCRDGREHHGLH